MSYVDVTTPQRRLLRAAYAGELYHHGVKGMKWGVRRYQLKNGTLTPLGRKRSLKDVSRNRKAMLPKGSELYRVSKTENSDAKPGSKLYVSADKKEHEMYKTMIGGSNIATTGKAYVQKYIAKNNIVIPSIKTQTKIESGLVKDRDIQKELVESFMKKGMTRERAAQMVKPINQGMEWLKASPLLALSVFSPTAALIGVGMATDKKNQQIRMIRNAMGDQENKKLNSTFEQRLKEKGYNAYRDTNDKYNRVGAKSSVIVIDPDKNTGLSSATKMTKNDYGKAYAANKIAKNKNILKNVDYEDLVKDGEKIYEQHKEAYVLGKHNKETREEILKKFKEELED